MTPQEAMDRAKIALMSRPDSVFFTTIFFSLKHYWDDQIPTACVNGTEVRFNPKFFMSLNPEERIFLLIHETMHVAYLHMERLHDREPVRWNIAGDHVINLTLIERGFEMPKNGYADPKFKGMSTDEVYPLIEKPKDESKIDMDLKPCDTDPNELRREVEDILVRASIQSKMQGDQEGTIPGDVQIFLNKLLKPKLPWFRILQKYMQAMTKNDYTFRKPNRRFFPQYHLPSLYSESLMNIAVAVDTSGSVSAADFNVFISEVNGILRMMKPDKLTLVQFDTQIKAVDAVSDITQLSKVKFTGGGGTKIYPVLKWAEDNKPHLLLVFTDGCFGFYNNESKTNIVWLIHNNQRFTAPFGKTIHYEV